VRRPLSLTTPLAVCAASLLLAACGTGDSDSGGDGSAGGGSAAAGTVKGGPGVDVAAKTIRIGDINALTGPASALGKPVAAGHRAYFKALNAAGGIDGWKVRLTIKDSGYQPQQHVQIYRAIRNDVALLNSFGSPPTKAIQALLDHDKLVTTPASFDSVWGADPVIAPVGTPYSYDIANVLDYYTRHGALKPKIGIVYQNDEYGQDGLRGYKAAAKALGFDDVGRQTFKAGDTEFTAQVQKLKAAGAKAVVVVALPSSTGPIVGTAATLGFAPQWILQGPAFLEQLITKDGSLHAKPTPVAAALKGALVTSFSAAWGDPGAPGMKQVVADHDTYEAGEPPSIYFALAHASAKVQAAILRKAIAAGDLSRAGILKAKRSLGTVDLGGVSPSVTYSDESGPPSTKSLITRIDPSVDGFLKPVEEAYGSDVADGLGTGA
jgi:ABC-type branched-subunit amino acid transport system substrate-binding protein